jgi:hypothetical protein
MPSARERANHRSGGDGPHASNFLRAAQGRDALEKS